MKQCLLIISCSQRKIACSQPLPAIERYDGVNFRVLRKLRREGKLSDALEILIISAKYGLLRSDEAIDSYDQKMTRDRALELQDPVGIDLDSIISNREYQEVFINLGKEYLYALKSSKRLLNTKVTYAVGGIGRKMAQMREWVITRSGQDENYYH